MSRWEGFEELVQVVETGSFSKAASTLGISKSHVSQKIAKLEDRLGARLLNRTTRRLSLTQIGESYYKRCAKIVAELEEAESEVTQLQVEPKGIIRIDSVSGPLGERFFAKAFAEFIANYPGLSLDLRYHKHLDLQDDDFDLAIGLRPTDSRFMTRRVTHVHYHICGSPAYFAQHPIPQKPEDLLSHNCLVGTSNIWEFKKGKKEIEMKVNGSWHANSALSLLIAAIEGLGITRLASFTAYQAFKKGQLIPVLEEWKVKHSDIWLVYPQKRFLSAKVRLLISFLMDYFNPYPPWEHRIIN
ncbi:LysR family transcriptional regulator [bacterium]|nr:LysR family transcriptional regulator [bacterium]